MRWLGALVAAITTALIAIAVLLSRDAPPAPTAFGTPLHQAVSGIAAAAVGALILWRAPRHAVGLIFAAGALTGAIEQVANQYATLATQRRLDLPGDVWAAWLGSWVWFIAIVLYAVALPIMFPTGRPLTGRWRIGLAAGGFALLALIAASALSPGTLDNAPKVKNPVGVLSAEQAATMRTIAFMLLLSSIATAIAAMVVRYRRSSGVERQQMKWLVYALAMFALSFLVSAALYLTGRETDLPSVVVLLSTTLIPVAAGIAIFRYRLYDIDILINRTLVYGTTTAAIGAAFFAGIVVLQGILRPLTSGSEAAVAISTLASVALFQPLRIRLQHAVDGRFYRSRYDAARTLDEFSVRLRDQVALDAVRADLIDAVQRTVQPAHASVWLRET